MEYHWRTRNRLLARMGRGFTLIEVLVVVAIIALLISILLPSLRKARWQAKVVACQGHLHDLGIAFQIYAGTYNGYFPLTPDPSTDTFCTLYRAKLLKNPDILICPDTQNVVRSATLAYAKDPKTEEKSDLYYIAEGSTDSRGGHSYEYNGCYNEDSGFALSHAHKKATQFIFPPHDMMLVHDEDEEREDMGGDPAFGCRPIVLSSGYASGNNCPQRWDNHGETGLNMMFGDGHVQWTKKMTGTVVDMRRATASSRPPAQKSVNATVENIWLKSQFPWRFHQR